MFGFVTTQADMCSEFFYYQSVRSWDQKKLIQKKNDLGLLVSFAEMSVRLSKGTLWALYQRYENLKKDESLSSEEKAFGLQQLDSSINQSRMILSKHELSVYTLRRDLEYVKSRLQ